MFSRYDPKEGRARYRLMSFPSSNGNSIPLLCFEEWTLAECIRWALMNYRGSGESVGLGLPGVPNQHHKPSPIRMEIRSIDVTAL